MTNAIVEVGDFDRPSFADRLEPGRAKAELLSISDRIRRFDGLQRVFDILVVVATAPLTLLAMAIAVLLIAAEDRGPIFFTQDRVGRGGRRFRIYKLRTMRADAEGGAFTSAGDNRVTRIGRTLRKYRIDELPQILNVLRGEMSICGPRPEVAELDERYSAGIAGYELRHLVRPGITGWAQIRQGYAAGLDAVSEKLRYDLFYMARFSVWFDLKILALTVVTLATGKGAR